VLPGGSTNVVARTLGIPNDVVDATEHLLSLADDFRPRTIDLGDISGRRFVFACGVGLDATVVQRVDSHPALKRRAGHYYYAWAAVSGFYRRYLRNPIRVSVELDDRQVEGITAVAQNSDPFTYFRRYPVRICEGVAADDGKLALAVLKRAAQRDVPTLIPRLLNPRLRATDHRQIEKFDGVLRASLRSVSRDGSGAVRPFPVQVDGDYIGELTEAELSIHPGALTVVA
jgi:diacylglycerol kinase family enzyme